MRGNEKKQEKSLKISRVFKSLKNENKPFFGAKKPLNPVFFKVFAEIPRNFDDLTGEN